MRVEAGGAPQGMDLLRTRIPACISSHAAVDGAAGPSLHSPAGECPAGRVPICYDPGTCDAGSGYTIFRSLAAP
jgi:hypothetical protein